MADEKKLRDYLGRVIAELHETRQRLRAAESGEGEPIAVVAMSCHLPGGVRSPEDLWQLLAEGRDAITAFPADRGWNAEHLAGRAFGGFLHDAAEFDPGFFEINPREALAMDPQQRLALEVAWEAVERAGISPHALRGSRTGVFVGTNGQGYDVVMNGGNAGANGSAGYVMTGSATSVVSGRIAYTLGLEGPAVTVDSACSSSLTALHLAGHALRSGDCTHALVGGVTVMAHPTPFHEFHRQRGLASDGRCKAFAASADGMGMAEGAAMVMVTTLSRALAEDLPVLAVVRGSAVNQDGGSNGLTAPNGPSQERVIAAALANARLAPEQVDAIEAHGTGTTLGDPIEAQALLAAYGTGRDRPLWLGSLKSNIGHTQSAAGVASVIKSILALRHGTLPRTLHADEATPHVDWSAGTMALLTEAQPWPRGDEPRRIGISSFGISGTNAHVILEDAPGRPAEPAESDGPSSRPVPLLISARTTQALPAQADRLAEGLADQRLLDVGYSLATTRAQFEHRALLIESDVDSARAALTERRYLSGRAESGRTAFLFTGQGSQRVGMGRELYDTYPVFAAAMDEITARFEPIPFDDEALLNQTEGAQAALFALEVALFRLLESWGIKPDFLLGHSIGELAAAHVAGVLSLDDACTLVAARGRLMQALPAGGAMLAAEVAEDQVPAGIDIAAINSPTSLVVSGTEDELDALAETWRAEGRRVKKLVVSHAFHSRLMEPILAEFAAVAESLTYHQPKIRMPGDVTDPAYWVRQVRDTVRFGNGVQSLRDNGVTAFLELGPDAALSAHVEESVAVLRSGRDEVTALLTAVGTAWVRGVDVDWAQVLSGGRKVPLPTYAFQRERFWPVTAPAGDVTAAGLASAEHPLLGAAVSLATDDGALLTGRLSVAAHPWLAEHVVLGTILVPGTAFVELALRAGEFAGCPTLDELTLQTPLALPATGGVAVQLVVGPPDADGRRPLTIFSRADGDWVRHAEGVLSATEVEASAVEAGRLAEWPPAAEPLPVDGWYAAAAEAGLDYGPAFRGLTAAWRAGDTVYAEVALPDAAQSGTAQGGTAQGEPFGLHPALLDAALHAAGAAGLVTGGVRLPFAWSGVRLHVAGAGALRVRLTATGTDALAVDLADSTGSPVATIDGLTLRPADATQAGPHTALFTVDWVPAASTAAPVDLERVEIPTACDDLVESTRTATYAALAALQSALAHDTSLAIVTTGGVAADAVAGLVRAAQLENPDRFVLVDTDGSLDVEAALGHDEPHLRIRAGQVLVPRLARDTGSAPNPGALNPDGTVLITGGTGALGTQVARHLVERHGIRHLVLVSRTGGPAPELDADVTVVAADVTDRAALAEVLAAIPAEHPLTGIVHAAGVVDDGITSALTPPRVDTVLDPKVRGAVALHELTADADLALFVLFSSASATFGAAGQANYAAANGFLDGLARHRAAHGKPAVSIGWGLWAERSGITGHLDDTGRARITRAGGELSTQDALALLDRACAGDRPHVVAMPLDLDLLQAQHDRDPDTRIPALLRGLVRRRTRRAATAAAAATGLGAELAGLAEAEQSRVLVELIRTEAATVLGHASAAVLEAQRSFKELGFDSLTAVELRNRLSLATGLRLPATLVFDYPSPEVLAAHLRPRLLGIEGPTRAATTKVASDEPIAIIGMSCRYPGGVDSPDELWRLVATGTDAISPLPTNRGWQLDALYDPDPDSSGKSYVVEGGFVHDADTFDPAPFGISPREALAMDPQQRLMLEASWEAFERAGIDPTSMRGSRTGVFTGLMYYDYAATMSVLPEGAEGFIGTGTSGSVLAGRVSYTFGLEGPAMTVDTACSSSLVTLHLAAQALRTGECDMALAGGVTVLSTPAVFVEFSRQRALSRDGRCKAFAAAADGTGWSEGIGMVLVTRLSDAQRAGYPITAVIRGSAVNQDGASNGLTAPNGPSQERVIRAALTGAGLRPSDVDAVEAHGTGTTLGDPIEAQALLNTYGQERASDPLWLGSLKSNIGHSQAAAGIGGVIKMVMAMRHGVLPKTLHIDEPTPEVDWTAGAVSLLTESRPWPETGRRRRAGVSSFGVSGTNAHVILEEYPADAPVRAAEAAPALLPWVLSARTAEALRDQATRLASTVDDRDPRDVASVLVRSRASLEHRAVVLGSDRASFVGALQDVAGGRTRPGVLTGVAGRGAITFVFPGQGSQWAGMAVRMLEDEPVFRARVEECAEALAGFVDWSLLDVLRGVPDAPPLERVDVVQPVLWAVNVSLAALWQSVGVRPSAVVGHSQGEIAAAVVAGGLSLLDGARVVALRSLLLREFMAGKGGMVSLSVSAETAERLIAPWDGALSIAGLSGPLSTVVSGDLDAVDGLLAECERRGLRARRVPTDCAGHSRQADQVKDRLLADLAPLRPRSGAIPFYSAVTGGVLDTEALDAEYWWRNLREPVLFEQATRNLLADGRSMFVETSAHPVLTVAIQETLEATDTAGAVLGTLRRDEGGRDRWLTALADAHVHGVPVDWTTVVPEGHRVDLPTYAFQRSRFWPEQVHVADDVAEVGLGATAHPLLGAAVPVAGDGSVLLTGRLAADTQPWLAEHVLRGTNLVPGTAFVEMALLAGAQIGHTRLGELTLQAPLAVPERDAVVLQVIVGAPGDAADERTVTVFSRPEGAEPDVPWTTHATGHLLSDRRTDAVELTQWPPAGAEPVAIERFYAGAAAAGYVYGPTFQGLRAVWRGAEGVDDAVYAEIALPEQAQTEARRYGVHPALLDAALHAMELGGLIGGAADTIWLPFAWRGVVVHAIGASSLRVRLSRADGAGAVRIDLADPAGAPVLTAESMVTRAVSPEDLRVAGRGPVDSLFRLDWVPASTQQNRTQQNAVPASWSVIGTDSAGIAERLVGHVGAVDWHGDLDALLEAVDAGRPAPDVVVWSGDTPAGPVTEATRALLDDVLLTVQGCLDDPVFADATMVVLTHGAVATTATADVPDLAAAAVRGLIRTAQSENPDRFVLVDLDEHDESVARLADVLTLDEPQLAVRRGTVLAPRLARADATGTPSTVEGPVLVTGGTGMIGGVIARHLAAEHGVRELLLLSRSGPAAPGAAELVADLAELGARAEVLACDVADRVELAAAIGDRVLGGVVHAAGALDDGVIGSLAAEQFDTVLAPKLDAAVHLDELTEGMPLGLFVLFSSAAATMGSVGQGNYAAANAFLDALAQRRRAAGRPGSSIGWGMWARTGAMGAHLDAADLARATRAGAALSDEDGRALFDAALHAGAAHVVATRLDLATLRAGAASAPVPALLRGLVRAPVWRTAGDGPSSGPDLVSRLAGLSELEQRRLLLDLVRGDAAAVLGHASVDPIDPERGFMELGFSSLTAIEIRNRLAAATGMRLPSTLIFDHPTAVKLAEHLRTALAVEAVEGPSPLIAELDRLEAGLALTDERDETRARALTRLHALIARYDVESVPLDEVTELDLATDEQMFALIDGGSDGE
ncbi:type I polyketide synthase [Labedaea rhizosphaerae]|uniref:6-deoxyerythronolide-B synthase n=1 Tax=Labedaea rhizosphaerae TaxID=598644 RepID=A0A4R6S0B3_LABRH|nr:type I polyketide synthase [Labedaea rhizosphaerae]TDP92880.1 acyl transferase domain-containing protein [Labedaea rhizosphaerae]